MPRASVTKLAKLALSSPGSDRAVPFETEEPRLTRLVWDDQRPSPLVTMRAQSHHLLFSVSPSWTAPLSFQQMVANCYTMNTWRVHEETRSVSEALIATASLAYASGYQAMRGGAVQLEYQKGGRRRFSPLHPAWGRCGEKMEKAGMLCWPRIPTSECMVILALKNAQAN